MGRGVLEDERGVRGILRGDFDGNMVGAEVGEALADDPAGQIRAIAVAAQVSEVDPAQVGGDDLFGHGCGGLVREMTVTAEDALFDTPGSAEIVLEHLDVVVGFQEQHMGGADTFHDEFGGMTEVGHEAEVACGGAQEEPDRILGIMGDGKGVHAHIADVERSAGVEDVPIEFEAGLTFDRLFRRAIAVNGDLQFLAQADQAAGVVLVFMCDEDGLEAFRRPPDAGQALSDLAAAKPDVDEHASIFDFEIRAVAARAAAQDRQLDWHARDGTELDRRGQSISGQRRIGPKWSGLSKGRRAVRKGVWCVGA